MAGGKGGEEKASRSAWADLLTAAGRQLVPVLLTGASLVGFVAFAGGVIVWTRFSAAKVPPDQAVNAVPREELVAIGSALLLLFGFFGVLALVCAFLVDRGARATPGMARALLFLFLVEAVTTVVIADGLSLVETTAAAELIALPVAAVCWATFVEMYVRLEDDLPTRRGERPGPRRYDMFLLSGADLEVRVAGRVTQLPILIAWIGIALAIPLIGLGLPSGFLLGWLSVVTIVFGLVSLLGSRPEAEWVKEQIEGGRFAAEAEERVEAAARDEEARRNLPLAEYRKLREREEERDRGPFAMRLLNERPQRLVLEAVGVRQTVFLLAAAVALPCLQLGAGWIAVSVAAAAALSVALWRIATLSAQRVIWYGVAVFLSVPLFGTLTAMARNVEDPQVQPMALIRSTDGPDEAIQGLYVTEADDRVYFATVATEGCSDHLRGHSGRLEWVPKSEVVAMSVGPLQDVDAAASSALEMAYALTPAVETPAGAESSFTSGEMQAAEAEGAAPAAPSLSKRLEDAGPAVRPYYGAGLSLSPDNASPGDRVTLRMSAPNGNDEVHGFGRTRSGHTVRIGGVRADILKEYAHRPDTAEFLETQEGKLLRLEKGEPYIMGEDGFEQVDDLAHESARPLYLKLVDSRVISVGGETVGEREGEGDQRGVYLQIGEDERGAPVLADSQELVMLKGTVDGNGDVGAPGETHFRRRPKTQAWHEREIRFVVPDNVSTGAVTVECSQLAGQPLLRVAHAPEVRVSVHMQAGSSRVTFDSKGSRDADGEELSRHWNIAGLQRGNREEVTVDLPPRPRVYVVRMTATDASGRTDMAEVRLLRLPVSLFELDKAEPRNGPVLKEARETLRAVARAQPPAAIEIDGHADDPGTGRHNMLLSLRRAEQVREELLKKPESGSDEGAPISVRTLAYGEGCPADPRPGRNRRNRRVDVFVLDKGVRIEPPSGCHPRRFQSTTWHVPPQPEG